MYQAEPSMEHDKVRTPNVAYSPACHFPGSVITGLCSRWGESRLSAE